MSAPLANRKLCLRHFYRLLKSNTTLRKYSVSKKTIKEILYHDINCGKNVLSSEGWVKSIKRQKRNTFFHISDGTSPESLQVIADPDICSHDIGYGCSVSVEGELVESPARGQNVELKASHVQLIGSCNTEEYPLQYKQKQTLSFTRKLPHLRPRTEYNQRMLNVRNTATMAVHNYFQGNDFLFVHTPIITSSNCEGAVEMFNLQTDPDVDIGAQLQEQESSSDTDRDTDAGSHSKLFFNRPVYMTVSGQLHLEVMTGCSRKVYNFGPTFRAEPSLTPHHLAEFYMIEAELAFTENLESICQVMESLVKDVTKNILSKHPKDFDYFKRQASDDHAAILNNLTDKKFIRITYTDAIKLLQSENTEYQTNLKWGDDLSKEHEKFLVTLVGNTPVFVTDFPGLMKPFYCRQNEDGQTVAAVDLLVPGVGELFGGSLREERYDVLKQRLDQLNFTSDYDWYLDLRRYGTVPHGGFGMGFERYLQCLLGIQNIKDTIPFPRWPQRCLL